MTIERSHGKARPTLPRASDLAPVEAGANPCAGRGEAGRFAAGNRHGVGARWKHAVAKSLGRGATDGEGETVARDAWRVFCAFMRSMPSDAAPVRSLATLHARHVALHGYYTTKATAAGLDTDDGQAFDDIANKHSQRAERLAVTAIDIATKLAKKTDASDTDTPAWLAPTGRQ